RMSRQDGRFSPSSGFRARWTETVAHAAPLSTILKRPALPGDTYCAKCSTAARATRPTSLALVGRGRPRTACRRRRGRAACWARACGQPYPRSCAGAEGTIDRRRDPKPAVVRLARCATADSCVAARDVHWLPCCFEWVGAQPTQGAFQRTKLA